jgi:hypothetical protein
MAFTRQLDDPCESKKRISEATGVLSYIIDPTKYYNNNPCFIDKGIISGNAVSLYRDNIVDLESDLTGRTRALSKCPSAKFLPGTVVQGKRSCKCGLAGKECNCTKNALVHLPKCKMINYSPKIRSTGVTVNFPLNNTYGYTRPPVRRANGLSPIEWSQNNAIPAWSK